MGNSSSKHGKHGHDKSRESRTKKNLKSADRLERDRHSDNGFFHRQVDYEHYENIRDQALRKAQAQGARLSEPIPSGLMTMPNAPAPIYHQHSSSRRPPPPPPKSPRSPSSVFTFASAVPAPLSIKKRTATSLPPPPAPSSSSRRSRDVPSTGRPMFAPTAYATPSMPAQYYPPTSSKNKTTRPSSSRRAPSRSPTRQPQSASSKRHGPSTARYPPSSNHAPPPLSSRNILPQAQAGPSQEPQRSGRRRVSREDARQGRRLC